MSEPGYDLIVIGGGEAGISAALRASELGARTVIINRETELGGGCVQTGTLPSKTLSNAAHFLENLKKGKRYGIAVDENVRADYRTILESRHKTTMCEVGILVTLLRRNNVETVLGEASFAGPKSLRVKLPNGSVREMSAPKIVIATGSRPASLPGLDWNRTTILSPDDLTAMDSAPRRFLIVGAGVIGCEMAFIFRSLGSEVLVVEKLERALPGQDHDVAALITREFKKRGIKLITGRGLERLEPAGGRTVRAVLSGGEDHEVDRIMIAVGRHPNTEGLNLAAAGIQTGRRGEIEVDEHMETSAPGVFAAGDVLARVMLSSLAVVEARVAAENAMGVPSRMDYSCAPWGIYTDPEIGSVGLTEEQARERALETVAGECGYNDLVRGCLDGSVIGLFKLIFEAESHRLVGAHIVGQDAAEIIHFAALAVKTGARAEDIRGMVFNHPTVSEGFGKAAAAALTKLGSPNWGRAELSN
jgi:dihydrolipoamide dehydrogenase